ncbi:hypothetical protein [Candidatus Cryosericum odellii]|jgi:hypothetical protein|uniref:Uncharacterized protein n=1 Tax=Candidatus Cryosericum odellii TaxID=2290917 RepID=A0A398DFD0_9BACT|nr:hypothetical protein [Candidatus Cryosericum odellii]RIE07659.1 hypothetical protein SMC6_05910 [Candidatus Cryosericum odellii]RIE09891.1 hypothetical protein SMC5_06655 [Candidatus Cryosericum odellii]
MNSNNIDRRVALSTLLIIFGVHFLLQAFPQTGYHFGILVPLAAFVVLLGIYGVATGFQRDARETVFWSAMLGFVGIIVLLQVLAVIRFSLTTFVGAAVISAGLSILLSTLFDSIESKTSRNGLIWGVVAVAAGSIAFLSGLDLFSAQVVDIIRKSAVGGLFLVLGLVVLIKGGIRK